MHHDSIPTLPCRTPSFSPHPAEHYFTTLSYNLISTPVVDSRRKKVELFNEEDDKKYRRTVKECSIDLLARSRCTGHRSKRTDPAGLVPTNSEASLTPRTINSGFAIILLWEQLNPRQTFDQITDNNNQSRLVSVDDFETSTIGEQHYPPTLCRRFQNPSSRELFDLTFGPPGYLETRADCSRQNITIQRGLRSRGIIVLGQLDCSIIENGFRSAASSCPPKTQHAR